MLQYLHIHQLSVEMRTEVLRTFFYDCPSIHEKLNTEIPMNILLRKII